MINPHTTRVIGEIALQLAIYGGGALFVGVCLAGAVVTVRNWKRRDY